MLCDRAYNKIIFIYQTTSRVPPVLDQLSIPASKINPVDHSQWLECVPPC